MRLVVLKFHVEMKNNQIHNTVRIHPNVVLGEFNRIGKNVVIDIVGKNSDIHACIGDNNVINDNTRILIHGKLTIGDWNVFHNDMLIMSGEGLSIGHNCWFGQNTILDGAGGLEIGNGVRVGMYSQIWTHVASGEQIEGCTLYAKRKTVIKDNVWLVGSCIVGSGIVLGERSTILINSVVTKDTLQNKAYAGSPAKLLEHLTVYLAKTLDEKFLMLRDWMEEFVAIHNEYKIAVLEDELILEKVDSEDIVVFTKAELKIKDKSKSIFYLRDKTFNKTNSLAERTVYKFLYANKARFLPTKVL